MVGLFAFLIYLPVSCVVHGWLISILWAWFAVPLGAPTIGVAHAVGLSCLAGSFLYRLSRRDDTQAPDTLGEVVLGMTVKLVVFSLILLLVGRLALAAM